MAYRHGSWSHQNNSTENKNCFNFNKCPSHTPRSTHDYYTTRKETATEGKDSPVATCVLARLFSEECLATWAACSSPTGANKGSVIVGRKRVLTHDRAAKEEERHTGPSVVVRLVPRHHAAHRGTGQNRGGTQKRKEPLGARK